MKLLLDEKLWRQWLMDDFCLGTAQLPERSYVPPEFPVFGYREIASSQHGQLEPRYLSAAHVRVMLSSLAGAEPPLDFPQIIYDPEPMDCSHLS